MPSDTPEPNDAGPGPATCPAARLSRSTRHNDGHQVVDLHTYVPYLLSSVNNALTRGASKLYLDRFGIGIVEWRVMSMLAIEPRIQAARVCEVIHIDKGAASRALLSLNEAGYLSFEAPGADTRKKVWWLNDRGYARHDEILAIALGREEQLIAGTDPEDLEAFLRVMRIMRGNVERMK
ncbi:MarR family winged helix-turn-helix transcriptional regulator [Seohaeicola saemankumensis]|nr:MarR family winged helix-turn-helix transcriptional regulator [Seohaeicola saemankumensis]MCA0871508.1 MarR family winged helix-turn-helix transcriptional regulator [Seohaeicola saemankumensis]